MVVVVCARRVVVVLVVEIMQNLFNGSQCARRRNNPRYVGTPDTKTPTIMARTVVAKTLHRATL